MAQKNLLIVLHWSRCMFCEERRVIYLLSVHYFVAVFILSHSILQNILVDLGNPIRRVSVSRWRFWMKVWEPFK